MRVASVLLGALVGCAYKPGSFATLTQSFPGQRLTIGCLDLSLDRRADLNTGAAVIEYQFANRCDHPTRVDLLSAHVVARTIEGSEVDLVPYDPGHEIRPLDIDGRVVGSEAIAYPSPGAMDEVCIDAASIGHDAASHWVCFASKFLVAVAS